MGAEGASTVTVKARIKALFDTESADVELSEEALVGLLKAEAFDLARLRVARYPEAAGIEHRCSGN